MIAAPKMGALVAPFLFRPLVLSGPGLHTAGRIARIPSFSSLTDASFHTVTGSQIAENRAFEAFPGRFQQALSGLSDERIVTQQIDF
jgi:hypothetical protein